MREEGRKERQRKGEGSRVGCREDWAAMTVALLSPRALQPDGPLEGLWVWAGTWCFQSSTDLLQDASCQGPAVGGVGWRVLGEHSHGTGTSSWGPEQDLGSSAWLWGEVGSGTTRVLEALTFPDDGTWPAIISCINFQSNHLISPATFTSNQWCIFLI